MQTGKREPQRAREGEAQTDRCGLQFFLAYRSLCPSSWVHRWDDQREAGNFPVDLEH